MPSALGQGALAPAALQRGAGTWAAELSAAGVNLNFAPVADVVPVGFDAQNQPIGLLHREFAHDQVTVATHVAAFVRGMQQGGVAVTLKHFPGLGRVTGNTDFTPASDRTSSAADSSFGAGIAQGADFVMVSLARYDRIDPQHLAVFSPTIITGMLRNSLGFRGVIVSDDLGAAAAVASISYGDRAVRFFEAGGDMVISQTTAVTEAMLAAVLARSAADPAFRDRLAGSVRRVLAAKESRGLLHC
jgi:beta-N-acetylhexosaminidase